MSGIVLRCVLLLLLLIYCEAAIVVASGAGVEMDARICLEMGLPHHEVDGKSAASANFAIIINSLH